MGVDKDRVPLKESQDITTSITGCDRLQNALPVIGTINIAIVKGDSLHVAILIEAKQEMIGGALEGAVVGRAFLIAIGRADRVVHIKNDLSEEPAVVNLVHPHAAKLRQELKILGLSQYLCSEPTH